MDMTSGKQLQHTVISVPPHTHKVQQTNGKNNHLTQDEKQNSKTVTNQIMGTEKHTSCQRNYNVSRKQNSQTNLA